MTKNRPSALGNAKRSPRPSQPASLIRFGSYRNGIPSGYVCGIPTIGGRFICTGHIQLCPAANRRENFPRDRGIRRQQAFGKYHTCSVCRPPGHPKGLWSPLDCKENSGNNALLFPPGFLPCSPLARQQYLIAPGDNDVDDGLIGQCQTGHDNSVQDSALLRAFPTITGRQTRWVRRCVVS